MPRFAPDSARGLNTLSGDAGPIDLFEDTTSQTEAEDLIEAAFLAGMIDGQTQQLAYLWLAANQQRVR